MLPARCISCNSLARRCSFREAYPPDDLAWYLFCLGLKMFFIWHVESCEDCRRCDELDLFVLWHLDWFASFDVSACGGLSGDGLDGGESADVDGLLPQNGVCDDVDDFSHCSLAQMGVEACSALEFVDDVFSCHNVCFLGLLNLRLSCRYTSHSWRMSSICLSDFGCTASRARRMMAGSLWMMMLHWRSEICFMAMCLVG